MDSSFGLSQHYQQRPTRTFDNVSQATSALGVSLKQVDIPCPFHMDEQSTNYCIESKCHQPLCSQCIEDHLLLHKKQGYSDLGIKSLRGLRKECIGRLGALIEELVRRLGQLEPPIPPEQQLENLQLNLEAIRQKMHQIIETEISRIKESLRICLAESANYFKSMAQIHSRLEDLIEQLRENHATLAEGGSKSMGIPECIKKTLTLDAEALLQTFQKEGTAYETRRSKSELQIVFQPQFLRNCLVETVKIVTPQSLNTSMVSMSNPSRVYVKPTKSFKYEQEEESLETSLLPIEAVPRGNAKFLHFFESGSNQLHLVSVDNRKRGVSKAITISEFVVPSFHASIMSRNGEFIFLSGGIVELNGGAKSPLFIRFSIKTQTCKKDFAKVKPRSSHSLCEDSNGEIYILGGYGPEEFSGGDPSYQMAVERVNPRSGRVEIETSSNWGGSNISIFCRDHILKACDQGIELYNSKTRQWMISEIKTKPRVEYLFFKNAGFASLTDSSILVFGGYATNTSSSDLCFSWSLTVNERPRISINRINCRLPVAEGFQNCCPLVDEQGFYVLQNVEYDEEAEEQCCIDNQRRLLRFNLHEGLGDWKVLEIDQQ